MTSHDRENSEHCQKNGGGERGAFKQHTSTAVLGNEATTYRANNVSIDYNPANGPIATYLLLSLKQNLSIRPSPQDWQHRSQLWSSCRG